MTRTTAIGYYHQNLVGLCQRLTDHLDTVPEGAPRERMWKGPRQQVVLAQGALEKPLVFDGNDRPGVMLAGAAQTYLHRYGVKVGNRPAIVTAHDSAWHTAFDLAEAGAKPAVIVDVPRQCRSGADRPRPCPRHRDAHSAAPSPAPPAGSGEVLRVNRMDGGKAGAARDIACDAVLMCGGWTLPPPLQPHPGQARLERGGPVLPPRHQDRGRADRRRRPRPLGHRRRAGGRRRGRPLAARDAGAGDGARLRRYRRPHRLGRDAEGCRPTRTPARPRPSSTSRTT